MLLMDIDFYLDFKGHVSPYSLAIFYWVKWGHVEDKGFFVFIKSKFLDIFSCESPIRLHSMSM